MKTSKVIGRTLVATAVVAVIAIVIVSSQKHENRFANIAREEQARRDWDAHHRKEIAAREHAIALNLMKATPGLAGLGHVQEQTSDYMFPSVSAYCQWRHDVTGNSDDSDSIATSLGGSIIEQGERFEVVGSSSTDCGMQTKFGAQRLLHLRNGTHNGWMLSSTLSDDAE